MPSTPDLPVIPAQRAPGCPLAPPPEFAAWRDGPGLVQASWHGKPTWVISRHADIRAALTDPRLSANTLAFNADPGTEDMPVIFPRIDDPEHHRLRKMLTREFTFRRAEAMRPQIQALVDRFLDEMIAAGPPADLVRSFALPVPSMVICLLLGVPYEDHGFFQKTTTNGLDSRSTQEEKDAANLTLFTYMFSLVERKEAEPGDDLMSRLISDHVHAGELNRATAAMDAQVLLTAGHETTASMIALGTVALLDHPEVFGQLRDTDSPAAAADIVEELMRYLTIVHSLVDRVAVEDLTINGQLITAGDTVLMNLPAGNWDAEFVSQPENFDASRATRGHLGFGFGVHQCIGANLARVELQIALTTLAKRLPDLALAVPADELRFQNEKEIYGLHELPVTW